MQKPKKVEVLWRDITECGGWNGVDTVFQEANLCHSVGWLVRTTTKNYYLTDCVVENSPEEPFGVVFIIPKGCVERLRFLK